MSDPSSQSPKGWDQAIRYLKERLIDTSKRNRLIHSPIGAKRGKHLDIVDERSDEVFKLLVHRNKKLQLDHSEEGDDEPDIMENIFIPDPDPPSAKHVDLKLQTPLTKDALHKRLLQLYRDSISAVEEQGFNPLFLALGFVRWFESTSSDIERFAPLILLPVELIREGVRDNFKLLIRDQDLEPNHSFDAYLSSDFDLRLPLWPESDQWLPSEYFQRVSDRIQKLQNWVVCRDTMQLGFYSSGKFLMSKDLDNAEPTDLMHELLYGGFGNPPPLFDPEENLDDRYIDPRDLGHIMEADSSQTQVIAAAREGRNMIVQGPPGTGKSQTIANIIAVSVRDHKTVLFVAEKRAALDVVYDRLESCGLGPLCLEMHSTKAQKKEIYQNLGDTLQLGRPKIGDHSEYERLKEVRDTLNQLSKQLHTVDEATGETPYQVIGQLTRLMADDDLPKPDFQLEITATWDQNKSLLERRKVERLAELIHEYGPEGSHPWRGFNQKMTPMARVRLRDQIGDLQRILLALMATLKASCSALSIPREGGLRFANTVVKLLHAMGSRPIDVDEWIQRSDVIRYWESLHQLYEEIQKEQAIQNELSELLLTSAFEKDWGRVHHEIQKHKKSFFRWLSGSYRSAIKEIRGVSKNLPKATYERLELLDALMQHQSRVKEIDDQRSLGELMVGPLWRGLKTDVTKALESTRWMNEQIERLGSSEALVRLIRNWPEDENPDRRAEELQEYIQLVDKKWNEIAESSGLDFQQAFREDRLHSVPLSTLISRSSEWHNDPDGQDTWVQLHDLANEICDSGLEEVRIRLSNGQLHPGHALKTYDYLRSEAVYLRLQRLNPDLNRINGRERSVLVEQFRDLDAAMLQLSSQEVMAEHYASIPEGTRGKMGVLRGEAKKKTRHMPLRKLLKEVGDAVQTIKPVFLMSPLSVAQYLDPDGLKFDLLLIDEASQVRPADAIGAVMRAKRAIIVGDQKQLPPTSFFEKLVNSENDEDEEELEGVIAGQVRDMESILALCEARGMPDCMLKWHYRSQHESLIAVSNKEFYRNQLVCPPSPSQSGNKLGLSFEYVDGIYRRGGGKSDNPIEAKAIIQAVLEHARERPDESLGIVAMSQSQQTTIQNEAEQMRAIHPELNSFCSETKEHAFFVKNLETVQGDERDVIFISIGYGRTENGRLFQNFGPVSNEGGERRLNVLFTRAKKRCQVFSSIRHTDIQHDKARHRGPYLLKTFLKYAETKEMDVPIITGKEPDSPFEEAVGDAIHSYGYEVDYQVGSEGFLIDLAVRDPDQPGAYLLAIECDGARYHSSFWARERDRMRQTLLEGKGWTFHRIWSTDWFNNPEAETVRAVDAIRKACVKRSPSPSKTPKQRGIEREIPTHHLKDSTGANYAEYNAETEDWYLNRNTIEIQDAPLEKVAEAVVGVIEVEGPVHQEIVVRRIREVWGYEQTGKLIKQTIHNAIQLAVDHELVEQCMMDPHFLGIPGAEVHVRDRSMLENSVMKKPEMIAPQEYREAILMAVKRCLGISQEDSAIEVARIFGFRSTSTALKKHVKAQVIELIEEGLLILDSDGTLNINPAKPID